MKKDDADNLVHELLELGHGARAIGKVPEDIPYEVIVKLGANKWMHFEDAEELREVLALLRQDCEIQESVVCWPNFVFTRAQIAAQREPRHDTKGRTACHGCGSYHQRIYRFGSLWVCKFCFRTLMDTHNYRPYGTTSIPAGEVPPFRQGQIIRHRLFGLGKVVDIERSADDWEVLVDFQAEGRIVTKRLVVGFSPLEVVDSV